MVGEQWCLCECECVGGRSEQSQRACTVEYACTLGCMLALYVRMFDIDWCKNKK
ncbi:hypothetical protein BD289DRAFT_426637 [Coniella lustricola]|uniref:Uncharacterized protein n=1 Tax=Coniella lustricola TaxID=2025994 RepID=A0A2T3AFS3_9PEZI|nr:hypothetical protein BD289DRAFT_426637 [Coniella lustricola]